MNTEFVTDYQRVFDGDVAGLGRVAVLFGGSTAERSVSLESGASVLQALQNSGVDAFGIDVREDPCRQLLAQRFDRAFIALHGVGGEDGKVQALLDLLNIPYTGSDHAASALAMNKLHTKEIWLSRGLPTPPYRTLRSDTHFDAVFKELGPVFVKPAHEGSSYGINPVLQPEKMMWAYEEAKKYDSLVLAEQLIDGDEFSVSILGNSVLPPIQIVSDDTFYTFDAKYISNQTRYLCPCSLSENEDTKLRKLALDAFRSLGCEGWGRIDFMRSKNGDFFALEANTVPGMTSHSLVPMAAREAGLSFEALVLEILSLGAHR